MARAQLSADLRRSILDRDNRVCQKCGQRKGLDIHHIQAVIDGGTNDADNLVVLCTACHREWHLVRSMPSIAWESWLRLPPVAVIIGWLLLCEQQPDMLGKPFSDALEGLFSGFNLAKSMAKEEPEND